MKKPLVSLAFVLIASSGCAGVVYELRIDSLSLPSAATKRTYVLYPGNRQTKEADLTYREFAQLSAHALRQRGFRQAKRAQDAEMVILLAYGIGEPEEHEYVKRVPVWGVTGIAIGSASSSGGSVTNTSITPTIGIVGTKEVVEVDIEYTRFLLLVAYDMNALRKGKKRQLWKTTVSSTGAGDDLRRVLPYMLYGAMNHIGTRTNHRIAVEIDVDDKTVKRFVNDALKQGNLKTDFTR